MIVTGQEKINNIPQELKGILTSLSARSSMDVGLLKSSTPLMLETKGGKPPFLKEHLLSHEAKEEMRPVTESF